MPRQIIETGPRIDLSKAEVSLGEFELVAAVWLPGTS